MQGSQVNVRVVDVHTGKIVWAESFSGSDAHREIAAEVGRRLAKR
jgi:curli biogenesis system outer membrane secretion channel CsgG